jgi:hypothetical protein
MIWPKTPIFVLVASTFYSPLEKLEYEGEPIQNIEDCQIICRRDIEESVSHYCTLQPQGQKPIDLFNYVYYVESPTFSLTVAENSPLRERLEVPIEAGVYDTFCAAYAIMLNTDDYNPLPQGQYRLRYGNIGRDNYKSDTVLDFVVRANISQIHETIGHGGRQDPPDFPGLAKI